MYTQFKELIERFPTSEALFIYLKSAEGGKLRIHPQDSLALIRYHKGESDFTIPHVKLFRSVVWNTATHRPVSITPFKSEEGETLPTGSITDYVVETFADGVLIGQFWDGTSWKIHTRSMIDARCRYYSEKTFNTLFQETISSEIVDRLDKTICYSWILQHPENRIVCDVRAPRILLVGAHRIEENGTVVPLGHADIAAFPTPNIHTFTNWGVLKERLLEWAIRYQHNFQGFAIRELSTGKRWKIRTESYNKARHMRSNTPRRDFVWLSHFKSNTLNLYLRIYPEEKGRANAIVHRFKDITSELFRLYTAKFKARSSPEIPPKFKSILHSMHQHYYNVLKPEGKTLTFPEAIDWMNHRDVPQMLYLINYELRAAIATVEEEIPFEPATITPADMPTPTPTSTPTPTPTPTPTLILSTAPAEAAPAEAAPAEAAPADVVAAVEAPTPA